MPSNDFIDPIPGADVVTLQSNTAQFSSSGSAYPLSVADGWLVLALSTGQRGYTRIAVDGRSGAETWMAADWSAGMPVRVVKKLMVKPESNAGFGNMNKASRVWESGIFSGTSTPSYFHLFSDGSGLNIVQDIAAGTETSTPFTWGFDGASLIQTSTSGTSTSRRTWLPLRNSQKTRYVIESRTRTLGDGTVISLGAPRVNYYIDDGRAR
jgi:hypothetical protein